MNEFDTAAAGMVDTYYQTGGVQITYQRDSSSATLTALAEHPHIEKWLGNPLNVAAADMIFTIRASSLVLDGTAIAPEKGDTIIFGSCKFSINNTQCVEHLYSTNEWKITAKLAGKTENYDG